MNFQSCQNNQAEDDKSENTAETDNENEKEENTDKESAENEEKDKSEDNSEESDKTEASEKPKQETSSDHGWVKTASFADLDPEVTPIVVKGYFIAKDKSGNFIFYNQNGDVVMPGLNGIAQTGDDLLTVILAGTVDSGGDAMLQINGQIYMFDYIVGLSGVNNVGGLGGMRTHVYAYDMNLKHVMYREMYGNGVWQPAPRDFEDNVPFIIYSTETIDRCLSTETMPTASDLYWIWDFTTDTVCGRFTNQQGTVLMFPPAEVHYYIEPTNAYGRQVGPYPSYAKPGAQIVYNSQLSPKHYESIDPVGWQGVTGTDDKGNHDLYTMSSQEYVQLPDSYEKASASAGSSIFLLKDQVWSLYQKTE